MKKALNKILLLSAIFACAMATSFAVVTFVHADTCAADNLAVSTADVALNTTLESATYEGLAAIPFTITDPCDVLTVSIPLKIDAGSPTDNIEVAIWSDSGGSPDTIIQSGTPIDSATLSGTLTVTTTDLVTSLAAGSYWLSANRSLTGVDNDNSNYVVLGSDAGTGDPYGKMKPNGGAWTDTPLATGNTTFFFGFSVDGTIPSSGTTTPSAATSSVDQAHDNLIAGYYVFLFCMAFMVWLVRKH